MNENDADTDTQIVNFMRGRPYVQSIEIIANFAREGPKKRESKEDKKFNEDTNAENNGIVKEDSKKSESKEIDFKVNEENKKGKRTIQRRIQKLKKRRYNCRFNRKATQKVWDKDHRWTEKKDGRAKYLVLKETIERDGELDKIIDSHIKGDDLDKKMILREINRCKRYILLPNQLDALASKLDTEDAELVEGFFCVFFMNILRKRKLNHKIKRIWWKN
ncbi:hypothetical protein [Methanosarcina horonobensis]|uniref:hypothetical protein n=1 Tax=Methanosarcina horonobensis TaxID=418008 RepID=UPI000A85E3D7|nr:hypothetical protein [Methanosarcina horonobensis]